MGGHSSLLFEGRLPKWQPLDACAAKCLAAYNSFTCRYVTTVGPGIFYCVHERSILQRRRRSGRWWRGLQCTCSMTMRLLFLYSLPAAAATVAPCALAGHRSTLPKKVVNGSVERIEFVQLPGNDSFTLRTIDWDTQPVKGYLLARSRVTGRLCRGRRLWTS